MATSWPVLVEHASSEAAEVAIGSIWASMARASMCGRPCEEREARSEVAGHLLSKIAALLLMCCYCCTLTGHLVIHVRCTLAG